MPDKSNRRQFLQTSAAVGIGYWVAGGVRAAQSKSPNERIAMAAVGVGGKGDSDSRNAASHGDMVAICDADVGRLNRVGEERWPKAERFTDFRKMLDEMGKSIDAVTVSTPDHTHAPPALMAMRMGKHCFCQKPLTRTVYEARLMGQVARQNKVATQMGNQGTADGRLRRAAAWLRAGVLGTVREVHVWTNRPIWLQGADPPLGEDPVPESLDWERWIGPAPMRPFKAKWPPDHPARKNRTFRGDQVYHPFVWRGWWDFGSGALGDMACHEINMAFMGLDLRNPISVEATSSGHNRDMFPESAVVTYEFPANDWRPGVKMLWYDGGEKPSQELCGEKVPGAEGKLVIGEKGKLWGYTDLYEGAEPVEVEFPESPGHFQEWVRAIRGGEPAMSNFPDYASPLTEVVLLGNLAVWLAAQGQSEKIEWDSESMKVKNGTGVETLIKPEYREGYTLDA